MPRLICDLCMKDAELNLVEDGYHWHIKCHGEEHLWMGTIDDKTVLVWSNIASKFVSASEMHRRSEAEREHMRKAIAILMIFERVRKLNNSASIWIGDGELLDKVIDALISMRGDLKRS